MKQYRRITIATTVLLIAACTLLIIQINTFVHARNVIHEEWEERMPEAPRSPEEIRAILESIKHDNLNPSFVPHSLWDNTVCAGNVISAVNFIVGENRLQSTAAWTFERDNKAVVKRIYSREQDFSTEHGVITETYDRSFGLDGILDMVGEGSDRTAGRIYIVGYHYRDTRADAHILTESERGGTLNSHLLLLLGKANGRWYGYHFFHDPDRPNASPFEVIDMGECIDCEICSNAERCMPHMFDLMYIWEVLGPQLPVTGAPIRLYQHTASYEAVTGVIGTYGSGLIDHVLDTIFAHNAQLGDNFPRVISTEEAIIDLSSPHNSHQHGQILGLYNGVPVYRHANDNTRGQYGLEYQCVEFVNRYYAIKLGHQNLTRTGDADTYWYAATSKDLVCFPNGSQIPPEVDDILTFDPAGDDDVPGHVAIVSSVTASEVCVVQQNAPEWRQCFSLVYRNGTYTITDTFFDMPAVGWSRRSAP